ncbi:hypothetical protein L1987_31189 [Smallanthus sonchifolius]|uniref:Uncharacterized protein n=1 Tax=Smallanthus sonchifolius TaxID=185202 RepID=A0ACB9I674_9ASTR|nr:hypothetical protein L1987_31189 [Smallanthus sonchifolius]
MNNGTLIPRKVYLTNPGNDPSEEEAMLELVEDVITFAGVVPGAEPFLQIIEFIMRKLSNILEEKTTAEEIKVPSVSELGKVAGVEFRLSPKNESIRNINFVQVKVRYCYLPRITLNVDSEVVLRNLVTDTAKDVKLLRQQKIIEGDLRDEEVVNLFNGIGKSRLNISGESELRKTVARLNMGYESTPRIWVQRTIEKRFLASGKCILFFIAISTALIVIGEVYLTVSGLNSLHMMSARFIRARLSRLQLFFFGPRGPNAII